MSIALVVVVVALVVILPLIAHAIPVWGDNPRYSGGAPPPPPNGSSSSSTTTSSTTVTLTNTTTTVTITKTYTQVVTKTYVVNHYIEYYMYPIIQWVFTLVNIGQYQAPGYHSVGSEELFTPGFGSSGIFVPVFAQEAIYIFNIAPSTKPQITGWYVGSTSQSSSPPQLTSQSVNTYLSGIQKTVNTIQNQVKVTLTNTTTTTTYWNYITQPSPTPGPTGTGTPPNKTTTQPPTGQEPWRQFWIGGPYGPNSGGFLGNTVVNYSNPGGPIVTYNSTVAQSYQQIWNQSAQVWYNAFKNLINTQPPGLLPPGVVSPPGFHNKFIHSGALAGVPIIGSPVIGPPISGLGGVVSSVGGTILNGVKNGWNWLVSHI